MHSMSYKIRNRLIEKWKIGHGKVILELTKLSVQVLRTLYENMMRIVNEINHQVIQNSI